MSFAQIALPLPIRQTFTYRVPEALAPRALPGVQVQVPFRGRPRRGFLIELQAATTLERVESLGAVLTPPLVTPHLLELARWIAEYYLAPLGEVLAATLPGGLAGFARSRARPKAGEGAGMALGRPERRRL